MAKTINGTSVVDNIKVWESDVTVNAGSGDDVINIKAGTGSTVNGQAGNDEIYIHAGSHTVYGGAGNDIMVTWGNAADGSRFEGGAGNDSFKIKGGNNHTIITGDGDNTILLDKGSGHTITGGNIGEDRLFICSDDVTNVTANLQNGENRATLWGGSNNTIKGGTDTDIFNVKGGKQNKLYGGAGKDYLIIHVGGQNRLYGGEGNDSFTVWHGAGDKNYIYGEGGSDTIEINGGNGHQIDGGDGYNTVKLKGGNRHTYTGGSGKDIVYISGGDDHSVNVGDGTNKIIVYSGTGHTINGGKDRDVVDLQGGTGITVDTGSGNDYINISSNSGNLVLGGDGNDNIICSVDNNKLVGGQGSDKYNIPLNFVNGEIITIDQFGAKESDFDILYLPNVNLADVNYCVNETTLNINHKNGGTINILNWKTNPIQQIDFCDSVLTVNQLKDILYENKVVIEKGGDYYATNKIDRFLISQPTNTNSMTDKPIKIYRANSNDVLDFSYYKSNSPGFRFSSINSLSYKNGSWDLIISFFDNKLTSKELLNQVWINNYFLNVNRTLSKITAYDYVSNSTKTYNLKIAVCNTNVRSITTSGTDERDLMVGSYRISDSVKESILKAGKGDDLIQLDWGVGLWTEKSRQIAYGEEGDDYIYAIEGNYTIYGGYGDDFIFIAGASEDVEVHGDDGDDTISINGYGNNNNIFGDNGDDILNVNGNSYNIFGCDGNDIINLTRTVTNNYVHGGKGNDIITVEGINNYIYGDEGNDIIYSGNGDNQINGGDGDDIIYGNDENDIFIFENGEGNDIIKNYHYSKTDDRGNRIKILDGKISKKEISNDNVIFKIGDSINSSITIEGAATSTIKIQDDDGQYILTYNTISILNQLIEKERSLTDWMEDIEVYAINSIIKGNELDNLIKVTGYGNTLYGNEGNDTIYCYRDTVHYSTDYYTAHIVNEANRIFGGDGNDKLVGQFGNDYLYGEGGNDILCGKQGSDNLYGGEGNDVLYGDGNDNLKSSYVYENEDYNFLCYGGAADNLYGGEGDDTLYGGDGNDELYGESGNDNLYGGVDDDNLYGGEGDDTLYGEAGNDVLKGESGNDNLYGGDGDDKLYAGDGNDYLFGGTGNDQLYGSEGKDVFRYESGNDTIYNYQYNIVSTNSDYIAIDSDEVFLESRSIGIDNITLRYYYNFFNRYNVTLEGLSKDIIKFKIDDNFIDMNINNWIQGASERDILDGRNNKKKDWIYGGDGDDIIYGGDGDIYLHGGTGNDEIHGGGIENYSSEGNYRDYEDRCLVYGGEGDDSLYSSSCGWSFLYGGTGNDKLFGYGSRDRLFGGDGDDYMRAYSGEINMEGGDGADVLFGGTGNNKLFGGEGDDKLNGGDGNDVLDGGREDDVLFGSFGNDILIGGMGNDIFSFERGYIGNNTIKDFQFGLDIIQFDSEISINDYSKFNNDLLLNLNTGGSIKIIEGKGKKISFDFGDGNIVQKIF